MAVGPRDAIVSIEKKLLREAASRGPSALADILVMQYESKVAHDCNKLINQLLVIGGIFHGQNAVRLRCITPSAPPGLANLHRLLQ